MLRTQPRQLADHFFGQAFTEVVVFLSSTEDLTWQDHQHLSARAGIARSSYNLLDRTNQPVTSLGNRFHELWRAVAFSEGLPQYRNVRGQVALCVNRVRPHLLHQPLITDG